MSIFSKIKDAIFGGKAQAATPPPTAAPSAAVAPAPAPVAAEPVDVEANLAAMAGAAGLNWKTSIVDLMKLLGIDFEPRQPQGARAGARLYRRTHRFGRNEHLAAQGDDEGTGGQRRQGSRRTARLIAAGRVSDPPAT